MKKLLPLFLTVFVPFITFAQEDSVSIGAGYVSQSYYSFSNGIVKTSTSDWDLAFGIGGFNVDVRTNDGHKVALYLYPNGDTSSWNTIDTTGLSTWTPRRNNENDWSETVMSTGSNHPDYGWGIYNNVSHNVEGDSIYIIKTKAGDFKKFVITGMMAMTQSWDFKYANLDGSDEVSGSIVKTNYTGKNFVYYSIDHDSTMDLEPMATDWDILFSRYTARYPVGGYYNVAGIQTNKFRTTGEAKDVDVDNVDWTTLNYVDSIGEIGWDWKTFNNTTFMYDISDSLTYFVADTNNNVWQITLTGFDYTIAQFNFNKKRVEGVSVQDLNTPLTGINVYPNPATDVLNISIENEALNTVNVSIFSITGSQVYQLNRNVSGVNNLEISVADWQSGVYFVRIENGGKTAIQKLIVQ